MQLRIDRNLPVPISEQIRGQVAYAIMCGALSSGDPLPSVQRLSELLGVAPATVVRAYRDLCGDGLTAPKSGSGTYVADLVESGSRRRSQALHANLQRVVSSYVRHAVSTGHTIDEIRREFLAYLESQERDARPQRIALIGNFPKVTAQYCLDMEEVLQDSNVRVLPVLFDHLMDNLEEVLTELQDVKLVVSVPTRLQQVRDILAPHGYSVASIAFQVTEQTRHALSSIAPNKRIGVVATYPEFLQSLLHEVTSYSLCEEAPLCAVVEQEDCVREMLSQIDVLVYASGSDRVLGWLPENVETIEYLHRPELASVRRLRVLLT